MANKSNFKKFKTKDSCAKQYFKDELHLKDIRKVPIYAEKYRNEFSRDRDRILYSTAFRRLSGKTQVFVAGFDTHVRTRLTHTLEVNQISTTLANALNLNATLCEAISLGHDIGHSPFGHIGEQVLNNIMNNCLILNDFNIKLNIKEKGFKHNLQSVRILDEIERSHSAGPNYGMNLTYFTLWGILNHSKISYEPCHRVKIEDGTEEVYKCTFRDKYEDCENKGCLSTDFYDKYFTMELKKSWSFEGMIVKWADEIAQRHHDIEDGLIAEIIQPDEINEELIKTIPSIGVGYKAKINEIMDEFKRDNDTSLINSHYSKIIVESYVSKYIDDVRNFLDIISDTYRIRNENDFWKKREEIFNDKNFNSILKYEDYFKSDKEFKKFLQNRIINSEDVQVMNSKGIFILVSLFKGYLKNPLQLPDSVILRIFREMENLDNANLKGIMNIPYKPKTKTIGEKRNEIKDSYKKSRNEVFLKILSRAICDQLSLMTDEFALKQFNKLYESESFKNF